MGIAPLFLLEFHCDLIQPVLGNLLSGHAARISSISFFFSTRSNLKSFPTFWKVKFSSFDVTILFNSFFFSSGPPEPRNGAVSEGIMRTRRTREVCFRKDVVSRRTQYCPLAMSVGGRCPVKVFLTVDLGSVDRFRVHCSELVFFIVSV